MSDRPRLSLVVPTLNEAQGIVSFLDSLLPVAAELRAEVLVVDDASRDGTAELARETFANCAGLTGLSGQVIVRQARPSLARSVLEGWAQARAPVLGVMDADHSHPPQLLPRLLGEIEAGADVAFATRYMPGGGTAGWPLRRRLVSQFARGLARTLVKARDPLSGFFMLRREILEGIELSLEGWKIGLEVLCRGKHTRLAEVPFVFRDRSYGNSKFGPQAVVDYLEQLWRLQAERVLSGRLTRR